MYEEILRQARYRLRHGAALYARKFRLSCSEMNGRYSSNEFIVEVTRAPSLPTAPHLPPPRPLPGRGAGMRERTEPPGGWGWKLQPRLGTPGSGLWVEKVGMLWGVGGGEVVRGQG